MRWHEGCRKQSWQGSSWILADFMTFEIIQVLQLSCVGPPWLDIDLATEPQTTHTFMTLQRGPPGIPVVQLIPVSRKMGCLRIGGFPGFLGICLGSRRTNSRISVQEYGPIARYGGHTLESIRMPRAMMGVGDMIAVLM